MLDEYKEFSKKFRLPEQRERIYADLRGRVAPSVQQYQYHKYDEQIIKELRQEAGMKGKIHITPSSLDFSTLQYDKRHIEERGHGVSEKQARDIIRTASVSVTVWGGQFERYYSTKFGGVVYVNLETNTIRTAYIGDEVKGDAQKVMEVLKRYGR